MDNAVKNTVLIVDDDELYLMALTKILNPEYTVYAAKNGNDAVEIAGKILPHVILLDILMPHGIDGYSVMAALKDSRKTEHIPVIIISGLDEVDDEMKGLSLGAADYICKPFNPDIVRFRVKNQMMIINQMHLIIEKEITEKSNSAKLEFLSKMSHDMLTPMNAIMGMTIIAKMNKDPDNIEMCLNEIDAASKELLEIINYLLEISVSDGNSLVKLKN